jgi:CheY-like chemotaxis protein
MTKTILLLDDDPDEEIILRDAFAILGIPVNLLQFLTLSQLLSYLEKSVALPEMLLLDVNMPQHTGIEAIRIIRSQERFRHLPIVMYSNTSHNRTIDDCFDLGVSAYMKKTNNMETLLEHLRVLMDWNIHAIFKLPITERTLLN